MNNKKTQRGGVAIHSHMPLETRSRSWLVPRRCIAGDDEEIRSALSSLPGNAKGSRLERVGILNADGEVYREINVSNALELLHLTARLNAIGYVVDKLSRQRRAQRYARIFSKRSDTPA